MNRQKKKAAAKVVKSKSVARKQSLKTDKQLSAVQTLRQAINKEKQRQHEKLKAIAAKFSAKAQSDVARTLKHKEQLKRIWLDAADQCFEEEFSKAQQGPQKKKTTKAKTTQKAYRQKTASAMKQVKNNKKTIKEAVPAKAKIAENPKQITKKATIKPKMPIKKSIKKVTRSQPVETLQTQINPLTAEKDISHTQQKLASSSVIEKKNSSNSVKEKLIENPIESMTDLSFGSDTNGINYDNKA